MKRHNTAFLADWLLSDDRKPLIVRGARQVGKTWLIRDLASSLQKQLIECNFEKHPHLVTLFASNEPKEILLNITALTGKKINPETSLLFLDEIQAAPLLLEKLRWFAEDMPELPVLAAGSLLDFTLAKHEFSMPVGRVSYLYLEPLSFEEFLEALDKKELCNYLCDYDLTRTIPEIIHTELLKLIKEYLIVGGMPAAVSSWAKHRDPKAVNQIHFDLLTTYRDDFAKYSGRLSIERLEEILRSVPRQLGNKFVYKNANSDTQTPPLKQALDLLCKARVCHKIINTAANGLPLGAEADEKYTKVLLVDCGLCNASLGLTLHHLLELSELSMINNGGMAEQLVGQLLRTIDPPYIPSSLYYWQRKKKDATAEVDYVLQQENRIIPLEVKAGTTGTLKSLQQFMIEKKKPLAIRVNSDFPTLCTVSTKDPNGNTFSYTLLSIPFYLVGQIPRLVKNLKI